MTPSSSEVLKSWRHRQTPRLFETPLTTCRQKQCRSPNTALRNFHLFSGVWCQIYNCRAQQTCIRNLDTADRVLSWVARAGNQPLATPPDRCSWLQLPEWPDCWLTVSPRTMLPCRAHCSTVCVCVCVTAYSAFVLLPGPYLDQVSYSVAQFVAAFWNCWDRQEHRNKFSVHDAYLASRNYAIPKTEI
jgi:hypothetical protein